MKILVRWTIGCWIALCVAIGAAARADDPLAKPKDAVASDDLQQGNKLYHARKFEKAIDAYNADSLREEAPVSLYNLGQCYRQLRKYEDAIWHYERFLSKAQPTGDLKPAVVGFIKDMKAQLEKNCRGCLRVPPRHPKNLDNQANREPGHAERNQLYDKAGSHRTLGVVIGIGGQD